MGIVLHAKNSKYVFVFSYLNGAMVIFIACVMYERLSRPAKALYS